MDLVERYDTIGTRMMNTIQYYAMVPCYGAMLCYAISCD